MFCLTRILSGGVVKRDEQMKFGGNYTEGLLNKKICGIFQLAF